MRNGIDDIDMNGRMRSVAVEILNRDSKIQNDRTAFNVMIQTFQQGKRISARIVDVEREYVRAASRSDITRWRLRNHHRNAARS